MSEVFAHSEAEHAARLVLIVLADRASDDGIAWPDQDEIAAKAKVSKSALRTALRWLEDHGEIETRQAQRGRKRINVHRIIVGAIIEHEPNYDRLPFDINNPFGRPPESGAGEATDDRQNLRGRPPESGAFEQPCPSIGLEPSENHQLDISAPPKILASENGKNDALDALAEVCDIKPHSRRLVQAVVALNGRKAHPDEGIRWLYWQELLDWATTPEREAKLRELHTDPTQFAAYLARAIRQRGEEAKRRFPDVTFGPQKFRDWFVDLAVDETQDRPQEPVYSKFGVRLYQAGEDDGFSWDDAA